MIVIKVIILKILVNKLLLLLPKGVECTRHFGNLPNVDDFIKKNDNMEKLRSRPLPGPRFINVELSVFLN